MARREYYTFGEVVHGLRIYYQELQEVFKSMKDKIDINLKNPELYDTKIVLDVPSKHDDDEPDEEYKEPRLAITNCRHPETLSIFESMIINISLEKSIKNNLILNGETLKSL